MPDADHNFLVTMPNLLYTAARSFKPLPLGEIFVGIPDTDPKITANQVQVYLVGEDGATTPIPQPIIINEGGHPVHNGQIISKMVTDNNYSLEVVDAYGSTEYYFSDISVQNPASILEQLGAASGITSVGGSAYVVDLFSNAIAAHSGKSKYLFTLGHHSIGIGPATYVNDGTTGLASSGNELKFYDADGKGWLLRHDGKIDCRQFGIAGDKTNETIIVQKWLDACATASARPHVPTGLSVGIVGIVLTQTHNNINFLTEGEYYFFGDGSSQVNKPTIIDNGACVAMYLHGVSFAKGNIKFNGGRTQKAASEQMHCIGIFGGNGHQVKYDFTECRGDGIYCNYYSGNTNAAGTGTQLWNGFPSDMYFDNLTSRNSEIDGRNALSLICYINCFVTNFESYYHGDGGRVIGYQPGGLDVEPNQYWQSCYNLVVNGITCTASGSSGGFSLVGKHNPADFEDTNIRGVKVTNLDLITRWFNAGLHYGLVVASATDVYIQGSSEGYTNPTETGNTMYGINISCSKQVTINLTTKRTTAAFQIGSENLAAASTAMCTNVRLEVSASHTHIGGRAGMLSGADIDLKVGTFVNMGSDKGDMGMLELRQAFISGSFAPTTQQSCNLSVNNAGNLSSLSLLNYGIRNNIANAVIPTGCTIDKSDLANVPHNPGSNQNRMIGTAAYAKGRIFGVTEKSGDDAIVGTSIWGAGDKIWHISSTATYVGKRYNGTAFVNFGSL